MTVGDYLTTIRGQLDPEALGLPPAGQRRVSGLRREEVAVLAGISVDYYRRLEQGRERNPSKQVIEALARGLDLAGDERQHLFRLAGYSPPVDGPVDRVRPELARQLDRWHAQAAFVVSGRLDVLAPNRLARALLGPLQHSDNLARTVFLDPLGHTFYRDWDRAAESVVSVLRHNSTHVPAGYIDPLIAELSAGSDDFRQRWADTQTVRGKVHEAKRFHHPCVGDMTLTYQALDVPDSAGQQVIIYDAEPGTASAEAFALLRLQAQAEQFPAADEPDRQRI